MTTLPALPSDMDGACDNWLMVRTFYTHGSVPPRAPKTREEFATLRPYLNSAVAYHFSKDSSWRVLQHLAYRYPCAMGGTVLTNRIGMRDQFGIRGPAYTTMPPVGTTSQRLTGTAESTVPLPPPVMGVLARAPVRVTSDVVVELTVYHMIAPDLVPHADGSPTPDRAALGCSNEFCEQAFLYAAAKRHACIWYLAFQAAYDNGFTKLSDVHVGGGAFFPVEWSEYFRTKVHDTAFFLLGYHTAAFPFPTVRLVSPPTQVPRDLRDYVHEGVLHVNAWCHSSFVGNGNAVDNTLDGAWGCTGPWAPLAWPLTNPWLRLRAVDADALLETFPTKRPTDRLCGKPPDALLRARGATDDAPPVGDSSSSQRGLADDAHDWIDSRLSEFNTVNDQEALNVDDLRRIFGLSFESQLEPCWAIEYLSDCDTVDAVVVFHAKEMSPALFHLAYTMLFNYAPSRKRLGFCTRVEQRNDEDNVMHAISQWDASACVANVVSGTCGVEVFVEKKKTQANNKRPRLPGCRLDAFTPTKVFWTCGDVTNPC